MRLAFQVLSVVAALVAAWLWWRASQPPPPLYVGFKEREGIGTPQEQFERWARSSARWNGWAARCTAFAVVLQAASGFWR
jgi:hypothetical protein